MHVCNGVPAVNDQQCSRPTYEAATSISESTYAPSTCTIASTAYAHKPLPMAQPTPPKVRPNPAMQKLALARPTFCVAEGTLPQHTPDCSVHSANTHRRCADGEVKLLRIVVWRKGCGISRGSTASHETLVLQHA